MCPSYLLRIQGFFRIALSTDSVESTLRGSQFHSRLSAVDIYDFHIFIFIYNHYHQVYDELTIDHLSMWLDSSVDRALHRYRKVMGSNPVQA